MISKYKQVLTSILLVLAITSLEVSSLTTFTKTVDTDYTIEIYMDSSTSDNINFQVTLPHPSWLAIGFGESMVEMPCYIYQANYSFWATSAKWSHYRGTPTTVTSNITDSTTMIANSSTQMAINIKRKLDTGVALEQVLSRNTKIQLNYAFVKSTNSVAISYHGQQPNFGFFAIEIDDSGNIIENTDTFYWFPVYIFHGWMLWGAWGVLGLLQLASARYLKQYWRVSMWIHRISGFLIFLITFGVGLFTIKETAWEIKYQLHTMLGTIGFCAVGFVVIAGIVIKFLMERLRWKTNLLLKLKKSHGLLGFILIVFAQIIMLTGGMKYALYQKKTNHPLTISHFIIFFLTMIVIEGIYQKFKRGEQPFTEPSNTDIISRKEFERRVEGGEQLVVLDDLVLNVAKFKFDHPGGKFVIDYNIGRDISKFFYGGYVLENGSGLKPTMHSNVARGIVNTLVIGRMQDRAKTFSARVVSTQDINTSTKCFILKVEGPDPGFKLPTSTDLEAIGQHFLVRSFFNPKVKRHYTLSTCMKKEIYDEYLSAITLFKTGQKVKFHDQVLQENQSIKGSEVIFTCKNYNIKGGLSHRLHTAYNDLFQIKGLMGKGLGIQSTGTHMAFVAGTGVLVFIDLVAYLVRQNLDLLKNDDNRVLDQSSFKFVLYASFAKREEAVALELIEGLQEVTKEKNLPNFEFVVRFSNDRGQRWDEDYIERQVIIHSKVNLKKIWVCGPPAMNELFDKTLERIAPNYGFNKNHFEIL